MPLRVKTNVAMPKHLIRFVKKKSAGQKALKKVNRLLSAIEHKYHDVQLNEDDIDYNGTFIRLDAVVQDNTDQTRDGDSLYWKNMSLRFSIFSVADAIVRCIILKAKDPTMSSVARWLQTVGDEFAPFSPRNHDYMANGKTLYDRTFVLDTGKTLAVDVTKFIPINMKCQFNAGATTVNKNGLVAIFISNEVGPSTRPAVRGWIRTTYSDN